MKIAAAKQISVERSWIAELEAPLLPPFPDAVGLNPSSPAGPGPPV